MDEKNDLISIDYDDNNDNYESFNNFITGYIETQKNLFINDVEIYGSLYLDEIEKKKKIYNEKKKKMIPYILKSTDKYTENELIKYSLDDVINIYNECKIKNRPFLVKLFHFIFNFD